MNQDDSVVPAWSHDTDGDGGCPFRMPPDPAAEDLLILMLDQEAQATLKARRRLLPPHQHGMWRGAPNPHTAGSQIDDIEL